MFPLLGLLGLGAAAMAKPYYDEWSEERMGRRATDALKGYGPDDVTGQQRGLLAGGLLSAKDYAGYGNDRLMNEQSLGPQWMNANTARQRLGFDMQQGRLGSMGDMPMQYRVPDPNGNVIDLSRALDSLSGVESGGRYDAKGPVNDQTGDRPYGRYQVMGANVGPWTERVLGRAMTPDEFLADGAAQDQVAASIFGENVQKYGLADAVSIWHSGVPLQQAVAEGRADVNMSTQDYVTRVLGGYEMQGQRAAAHADPTVREAQVRGPAWMGMKPEERQSILGAESGIGVMEATIDYLDQTSGAGRVIDPQAKAQMETEWNLTVLPFLQSRFQAGAMQEAELDLFQEFAGSGFDMNQFTGREQAKMRGLLATAKQQLRDQKTGFGISEGIADPFAGFTPFDPTGGN